MALLTCQDLSLGYDGQKIVSGLNFKVNYGDYLCIVGENGSGKSTLMKTILGLQASVGGKVLTGDGLKPNEIGYLPQQTVVQKDFPASVWEIVLSSCGNRTGLRPFYNKAEKQTAKENIEKWD
ncbi:MAG: ATP-binding cassette domain-containing protein [Clostridia bacterium]|nr:ATP-binding cassette domain-containing protein [Clostridia bacterium]